MFDEEKIKMMKEKLEKEFYEMMERGEDVKHFLYFPAEILTEKVKDDFLKSYGETAKNAAAMSLQRTYG